MANLKNSDSNPSRMHFIRRTYPSLATYSNGRSFCSSPGAIPPPPNLRGLTPPADLSSSIFRAFFSFIISLSCDRWICTKHAKGQHPALKTTLTTRPWLPEPFRVSVFEWGCTLSLSVPL